MPLVCRRRLTMLRTMQRRRAADLQYPVAPTARRWQELAWGWGRGDHLRRKLRSCRGRSWMAPMGRSLRRARRRRGLGKVAAGTGPGRRWRKRRGGGACRLIDKGTACGTVAGSRRDGGGAERRGRENWSLLAQSMHGAAARFLHTRFAVCMCQRKLRVSATCL
jgi:hypothetical protein